MRARNLGNGWKEIWKGKYRIQMLNFDEPSHYGINNGKISKLWIRDETEEKVVLNYDRGWDIELDENSPKELKIIYSEIIKKYN